MIGLMVPSVFAQTYTTPPIDNLKNTTWYVWVEPYPDWFPNANQVVMNGIGFWEDSIPGIKFNIVYSEYDIPAYTQNVINIDFVKEFGREHVGHAIDGWYIEVGMGDSHCTGTWTPYSVNYASSIAAHEIGHTLGFDHVNDPQNIMYPTALNTEYGVVEHTTTLTKDYGYFYGPVCTVKGVSTFDWYVSSDDPTYGFDVYFVPSITEFEKWQNGESFSYYEGDGCKKINYISVGGTCSNVSDESGLLILMGSQVTDPLTEINISWQENPDGTGIISSSPSTSTTPSSPSSDIFTPTSTSLYIDEYGKFSIEYPQGWFVEKGDGGTYPVVTFFDGEDYYYSKIDVYNFVDGSVQNQFDYSPTKQEIYDYLYTEDEEYCNSINFAEHGAICYNFIGDLGGIEYQTDYNVNGHSIVTAYTLQYEDDNYEYDMTSTISEITVGNDGWSIVTQTASDVFGEYIDILAESTMSLHVERGSSILETPLEPTPSIPISPTPVPDEPELFPTPGGDSSKYGIVRVDQNMINILPNTEKIVAISGEIFGEIDRGDKVVLVFTKPDGTTDGQSVFPTKDGYFETFTIINRDSPIGNYEVMVTSKGKVIGFVNFTVTKNSSQTSTPEPTSEPTPVSTPEPTEPKITSDPSFKKYTDTSNRFSIEYPNNWIIHDDYKHPDGTIAFADKYAWHNFLQVFWFDDDDTTNRSDSQILQDIETVQWELCRDEKFDVGDRNCSNFKEIDSKVLYTNDNKKLYVVKTQYTLEWKDSRGTENSIISVTGFVFDRNGSWSLGSESFDHVFESNSNKIMHMIKSFSLDPEQSISVPTPEPEQICGEGTTLRDGVCIAACGEGTIYKDGQCVLQTEEGGGCLIATAAFGSEMAPQVQFLRELRDNTILQTQSGTNFMAGFNQFYYSFSPTVADLERENPVFKEAVKLTLTPLLTSLTLLNYVDIDTESEMLGYGIGVILLNIGMYFIAPVVLIKRIVRIRI